MNLSQILKSVIDSDEAPIVISDTEHTIIYMNPSAVKHYEKRGGAALIGSSLMDCHNEKSCEKIRNVVAWFSEDSSHNKVFTFHNPKENKDVYMIALRDCDGQLIGYYEKHEYRTPESGKKYDI